jgi:acetate---CoA ligase (ADP-forming)
MIERFEGGVVLRDGSLVHVKRASEEDADRLAEFLEGLSASAKASRFQGKSGPGKELLSDVLPTTGLCLVAERDHKIVAEADYRPAGPRTADAGVVISDNLQRKGLGTILLAQLSQAAAESGITSFVITTPAKAHYKLNFVEEMGYPVRVGAAPGFVRVTFPTSITPTGLEAFEKGEAISAAAAVSRFLKPRSVAVIGASRNNKAIGGALFSNILQGGFMGPAYPVNKEAGSVQSVTAYRSVLDCPGPVDLAFVVVPAMHVVPAVKECGQKGVPAVVVISSGFAEVGGDGQRLQDELVEVCTESGTRLIGPNCMGIINTDPSVSLNGQFAPTKATPGRIGFLSQSGALGYAIVDQMSRLGLGLSSFVSVGNKADISSNDLIQYWEGDEDTRVILLHLESFGNPRKFARLAKRIARTKPIVVVKSGRSIAGFRGTQSHTGAIVAASDVTVDALFRQSGVSRTDTLEEMFDVAAFFSTQPLPKGENVAVITNAGGPGILAADACEGLGLRVPELAEATKAGLREFLLPIAGTSNPVDMTSVASAEDYRKAIRVVSEDPNVDALIVIFIPPIAVRTEDVAVQIVNAAEELGGKKPLITTFMAARGISGQLSGEGVKVPAYPFPESAARALAHAVNRRRWLSKPAGVLKTFPGTKRLEAAAVVSGALARGRIWLDPAETHELLDCYGIREARTVGAKTPQQAAAAAREFRGEVALKAYAPGLVHKSDVGGVKLGLTRKDVEKAAQEMLDKLRHEGIGSPELMVQEMVEEAAEMFVGMTNDPSFGPIIACGAGGTLVELIKDVTVKLTPLTDVDAKDMVTSLKTFKVLEGYRGAPKRDVRAFEETILRLGALVEDIPEISEVDLNPVFVLREGEGAVVADARVRVAEGGNQMPLGTKKR